MEWFYYAYRLGQISLISEYARNWWEMPHDVRPTNGIHMSFVATVMWRVLIDCLADIRKNIANKKKNVHLFTAGALKTTDKKVGEVWKKQKTDRFLFVHTLLKGKRTWEDYIGSNWRPPFTLMHNPQLSSVFGESALWYIKQLFLWFPLTRAKSECFCVLLLTLTTFPSVWSTPSTQECCLRKARETRAEGEWFGLLF